VSETAYKCVTADLKSPFVPWPVAVLSYSIGADFAAADGLAALSLPESVSITWRGIGRRGL
jgi:hypothetical protein